MARLEDIIKQVSSQITRHTSDFNDSSTIKEAIISAGKMNVELNSEVTSDSYVNIVDLYSKLIAESVTDDGSNQYTIEFTDEHDQTFSDEEKAVGIEKEVKFTGAFEGDYSLIDVPSRTSITIESDSEPTGTFYLLEQRAGYNGRKAVTFTDSTHFSFDISQTIQPYYTGAYIQNNIRVDGVSSPDDIADYLENEAVTLEKSTIFVVINEARASRNRFTTSDAKNRREFKDDMHIECAQTYSLFIVIPTDRNITPRTAINLAHSYRAYMIKCLHGAVFDSGLSDEGLFLSTFLSDDGTLYNKAYYIHRFDFETVFNIEADDSLDIQDSTAFRDFELGLKMEADDYTDVKKTITADIE